jgi:RNA polymerase sigma factor (sigma-70 family)
VAAESQKERLFHCILIEHKNRIHLFSRANVRGDYWQDLEQEILLRIWEGFDRYKGRANTKTWIYAIAYNTLKEFNRKNDSWHAKLEFLELHLKSQPTTYSTGESIDIFFMLDKFTQLLGDMDRTALMMHLDGCTYQEISEATESDEGALRVRLHRLKKQLAEYAGG